MKLKRKSPSSSSSPSSVGGFVRDSSCRLETWAGGAKEGGAGEDWGRKVKKKEASKMTVENLLLKATMKYTSEYIVLAGCTERKL